MQDTMKKYISILFYCIICHVWAKDTSTQSDMRYLIIPNLQKNKEAKAILYPYVSIKFGKNKSSGIKILKKDIIASKMTHIIFKDSKKVCENLLFFAIKDMQEQAIKNGGTKILNTISHAATEPHNSKQTFQCKVGKLFAIVVLQGDVGN